MNTENKSAIVTGGSSGIGAAIVKRLASEGIRVFFNFHQSEDGARETLEAVRGAGGEAAYAKADTTNVSQIQQFFNSAVERYGRPDYVVLNAGQGILKSIAESTEEDFDKIFSINAKGTFFGLRESGRTIKDNGSIVIVSSSTTAFPTEGAAIYAGSKAPLKMFAEVAARELGPCGINVNAIMPGVTLTRMAKPLPDQFKDQVASTSPYNRLGQAEDVANVIYSLLGGDNKWVTGQIILANGGGKQ